MSESENEANLEEEITRQRRNHAWAFLQNQLMPLVEGGQELTDELVVKKLKEYREVTGTW